MNKPKFYCIRFIECHNNIKRYQPADCVEQCSQCMDAVIDHHFNKKIKQAAKDLEGGKGIRMTLDELNKLIA